MVSLNPTSTTVDININANTVIKNSTAGTSGGVFAIGGTNVAIDVISSTFTNMIANNGNGGTFYLKNTGTLTLNSQTSLYEYSRAW